MRISHEDTIVAAQEQAGSLPIEAEEHIAAQEQHSLPRSILLHLLPGTIIFALFLLIAPLLQAAGFPPFSFTAMLIAVVVLVTTLGELLYQGSKRNVYLAIVLHSSLNVIPMLLQLPILFTLAGRVFGLRS